MSTLNNNVRIEHYKHATIIQQYFLAHNTPTKTLISIAEKHNLEEGEKYQSFATLICDIILGFYKIEDTVPLLQQELGIDAKTAALLGVDVLDFLAPLSDPNFMVPSEEGDAEPATPVVSEAPAVETTYQPEYFEVANPTPAASITTDAIQKFNAARAQLLAETSAPEMRTMASDMARSPERSTYQPVAAGDEVIHASEQPEVRPSLSGLPAYNHAPTPSTQPPAVHEPARWS